MMKRDQENFSPREIIEFIVGVGTLTLTLAIFLYFKWYQLDIKKARQERKKFPVPRKVEPVSQIKPVSEDDRQAKLESLQKDPSQENLLIEKQKKEEEKRKKEKEEKKIRKIKKRIERALQEALESAKATEKNDVNNNALPSTVKPLPESVAESTARFLINFSYTSKQVDASVELIKNLAFLFNLHRYVFAQIEILKAQGNIGLIVEYRTLLVHTLDKQYIEQETILETQQRLKTFIDINRETETSNPLLYFPSIQKFQELVSSLPVYQKLKTEASANKEAADQRKEKYFPQLKDWIRQQVAFMSFLHNQMENKDHPFNVIDNVTAEEYAAALKMMIIILGEYCDHPCRKEFINKDANIFRVMLACNPLRNTLAHTLDEVTSKELQNLIREGQNLNAEIMLKPTPATLIITPENSNNASMVSNNLTTSDEGDFPQMQTEPASFSPMLFGPAQSQTSNMNPNAKPFNLYKSL